MDSLSNLPYHESATCKTQPTPKSVRPKSRALINDLIKLLNQETFPVQSGSISQLQRTPLNRTFKPIVNPIKRSTGTFDLAAILKNQENQL